MDRIYSAVYLSLVLLANSLEERGSNYSSLAAMNKAAAPVSWKSAFVRFLVDWKKLSTRVNAI